MRDRNKYPHIYNSEYDKKIDLKRKYGITPDTYNKIFEQQNGCCKICGIHQTDLKRKLHVDHNHTTGEIRGLLCHSCNTSLGGFRDDPKIIKAALEYIQ